MSTNYNHETKEVLFRGKLVGHVVRRARVAAGAGVRNDRGTLAAGTRRYFWTAVPLQIDPTALQLWWRPGNGASIGTRFVGASEAVEALCFYHVHYAGRKALDAPEPWSALRKRRWGF